MTVSFAIEVILSNNNRIFITVAKIINGSRKYHIYGLDVRATYPDKMSSRQMVSDIFPCELLESGIHG